MKKILIALILALSMLFSSCNVDKSSDENGSANQGESNGTGGVDINSPCPDGDGNSGDTDGDGAGSAEGDGGNSTVTHVDENDDGTCDACGITVIVELNFFVINDFHGKMSDSDTQPGADELSLYLKSLVASNPNSILLSTGDMWQGGAESNLTKGLLVTEWMNELDFVAMALGNHEYDWGEEYIIRNDELAEFPLLAINVYDRDTNQRAEYCAPSVTLTRGGIEIGIIGAIGDCYSSISSDKCADVYFKTGRDLTALVKAESERLRASGVDYIVYTLHDGYGSSSSGTTIADNSLSGYYDISLSSGGYVDLVFEGHTHQTYALQDSYGVYHVQGGGDNKAFSHVSASVNLANGNDTTRSASVVNNSVYRDLEDDPYISELFAKYQEMIDQASDVLGYNPSYVDDSEIERLVAMLYYELGESEWGDDYNIVLGGGFLKTRSPYNLYAGEVTYADLLMLLPFDNEIMLCSIKGYDLKRKFIQTNNSDYHVYYGEYGNSVKNKINDNDTYYVIVDSYTAQYKYNNLTVIATYDPTVFARDLLADYIRKGGLNK